MVDCGARVGGSVTGWVVVGGGQWLVAGGWLVASKLAEMVGGEACVVVMAEAASVSMQGHCGSKQC